MPLLESKVHVPARRKGLIARPRLQERLNRGAEATLTPNVRPIAALKARVLVRHGRVAEALAWVREQGLSAADDLSYVREFDHISLANMLIASRSVPEALGLLSRLLTKARERNGSVIEILMLQALAPRSCGCYLADWFSPAASDRPG